MIELKRIIPECDADTLLVELLFMRGRAGHRKGISNTVKAVIDYPTNQTVIGICDTDKFKRDRDNPNIKLFSNSILRLPNEFGFTINNIPDTNKYLVRINPEFESWIWDIIKKNNISIESHGISTLEEFYMITKHFRTNQDPRLKRLLLSIINHTPTPKEIYQLREFLSKVF